MIADRAAAKRQPGLARLAQQREIDAEAAVGGFRSRDRLEHQIDRGALPDQSERRGHMGEHAALRRDLQPRDDAVEQPQQFSDHGRIVAVMPLASSKGWLGCSRTLIRPFRPMVLRNAEITAHFFATRIRSWLRISLETPAAISGVIPRETFASVSLVAASKRWRRFRA